jgi:protein-S-isoprenylcysteine O-methyltransferase Ste14
VKAALYLAYAAALLVFAYWVLRRVVRGEYKKHGRLRTAVSLLQLLVFAAYFGFLVLINPEAWSWPWENRGEAPALLFYSGLALMLLGMILAFGTMAWFGLGKAFGLQAGQLTRSGPYRYSRNPQIVGGYLMISGVLLLWPSWYTAGWVLLWVPIERWMIASEEEHLQQQFGEAYRRYCLEVPRYWFRRRA